MPFLTGALQLYFALFFCICSSSMLITEAKKQVLSHFWSGIWQVVFPLSECSLDTAHSGKPKFYTVEIDLKLTFVCQGVKKLFKG